jgi:microcystin degradation protein MlrC
LFAGYEKARRKARVDSAIVIDNEIRTDFAQRLRRRFDAMASTAEEPRRDVWEQATRVVDLMLAECNGEEEGESVGQD